ncbi:MAG: sodium:solute symporter family protein, partial [Ignavibacteria bacterium]|nr:sodium:solute symporter family protein [Ignavibacteria bacterium]
MVSFSSLDIVIIVFFFVSLLLIGYLSGSKKKITGKEEFLLNNRNVGLLLFILTNVSTWYGGILGVGEFTYRSGILSWVTQGLPYYIFAIAFAFMFAPKIRSASLFTIPDKLEQTYGRTVGLITAVLIFILVSPAPYILMIGSLIKLIFGIDLIWSLILSTLLSSAYLIKGGYRSDLYTDVLQFFVMFIGFMIIVFVSFTEVGGIGYLKTTLPETHFSISGGAFPLYLIVWFLIALWTFADPGFHQRCYAAKSGSVAKWGIIISIFFWILFDFLTTTTGLFARAALPNLENPVFAFPLYAEKILGNGLKGIFYSALFATIISTSNSFLFISGTTFGKDLVSKFYSSSNQTEKKLILYVKLGIVISGIIAVILSYTIQSVIDLWYLMGSFCLPGLILLIFGSYYDRLRVSSYYAILEIIIGSSTSIAWHFTRDQLANSIFTIIEPMIVGLTFAVIIHLWG